MVAAGRLIPLEDEMQADQAADEIAMGAAGLAPEYFPPPIADEAPAYVAPPEYE